MTEPNAEPNEPRSRRDALADLQARVEAAIDEVRPKIRRALDELETKVDAAVAEVKPRARSAMREVQPKVDQFVADVQPRIDAVLSKVQSRIDELRRELDERATRTTTRNEPSRPAGEIGPGEGPGSSASSEGSDRPASD